ncbi:MAG: hypothetical protein AAFZ15_28315 [Bacteroidota bacterium]
MKNVLLFLFVLLFVACGQPTAESEKEAENDSLRTTAATEKDYSYLDNEIAQLDDNVKIRKYWEAMERLDKKYRQEEPVILQQKGYNSKEYQDLKKNMQEADAENIAKAERMLAKHGFPLRDSFGPLASNGAYLVVLHAPTYEQQSKNFKYLYDAYQKGGLMEGPFSFYLNQMYDLKMGKMYEVSGSFREEDRINGIIEELGLLE